MFSNKERLYEAINFLKNVDTKKINIEKEFAIERSFEIIGGVLDSWAKKELIPREKNGIIDKAINARHKLSHLYTGLNIHTAIDAISDLKKLEKELLKYIK